MEYVYRFINNDSKIIYVGKTNNMKTRMIAHKNSKEDKYRKSYKEAKRIEYIELETIIDARIKELYYINLYKPKYNGNDKKKEEMVLRMEDDTWLTYKCPEMRIIQELKGDIGCLEYEIRFYQGVIKRFEKTDKWVMQHNLEKDISRLVKENQKLKQEIEALITEDRSYKEIKELLNKVLNNNFKI